MANITILEALNRSLIATKKYVDDKVPHYNETLKFEISGDDYRFFYNNSYFNMNALNLDETKSYVVKNKFDINDDEEYTFKFVYDKENDVLINEDNQLHIYNHKSYNGTNLIEDVNSAVLTNNNNITPMITMPEYDGYFRLYEIDKVELDSNCLPKDVSISNSLTVGTRIGDIGKFSVVEGDGNTASGYSSHAEGLATTASGGYSHAEGNGTTADNMCSHAEGDMTTASGDSSHAEGKGTIASSDSQHVQGKYNIEDTENKYAHIVGNGKYDYSTLTAVRSNAHTLDWDGNAWYKGKLSQDGTPTEDKDLVTKKYVDEKFLPNSAIHTMTLKLNTNEVNFIQSMETNNYNNPLEHITKGDLSSIIDNSIETIIFEGLERYPYKVVGAYRGFNNIEHVLLELAISDSEDDFYAVHRLQITYSNDLNDCFLSSYYGDLTKISLTLDNTTEYTPTEDYNPATKKYVDEKVAEVNASGGYTHPDSHPASMITGLATVATSGSYNDLNDKPTIPDVSDKANISGQVFTGAIEAPTVIASTYFRTPALVGEGDNSAYYHRVNFGYQNHDYWEFHEYGGDYRFYENKNGTAAGGTMIANIKSTYSDFKGEVRENGTRVYSPNNKPTADDLGITIPSIDGLATETYVNNKVAGLIDSAPEALNTLNELATALGNDANFATTISNQIGLKVNSADLATVATSGSYNDLSDKPTIPAAYTHPASHPASMITGLHTVATSGDYNDLNNKPSIPTVTNDLTDSLKANYDAAYTHSTSAHAPSNAQKNSDILKSEIEAKLTGNITTHTHSQYLTSIPSEYITEQELTSKGYATESQINSAIEAAATTHEEVKTTVNQILGGAYIE